MSVTTTEPGTNANVSYTNIGTATNAVYNLSWYIPRGAQGIPGETGATGATGPQGPKGDKGDKGDTGTGYIIMGQLDSKLDLPDPGSTDRQAAYLVGANEPYELYVIVGTIGHLEWFDAGPFTTSQADINQFEAGFGLTLDEVDSKIEYAVDTNNIPTHTDVAVAINSLSSSIASTYATKASLSSFQSDVTSAFSSVYGAINALSSVYATPAQVSSAISALTIPSITASYSGSYWTEMTLNGVTKDFGAGGSASVAWGDITGDIADQSDLQNALNDKVNGNVVIEEVPGESSEITGTISNDGEYVGLDVSYGQGGNVDDTYTTVNANTDVINLEAGRYGEDENQESTLDSSTIEITPEYININSAEVNINGDELKLVDGTNDGTNWTSLTIGEDTYGIGGGSAPSNMVTTNTAQTISGAKTYTTDITLTNAEIFLSNGYYLNLGTGKAYITGDSSGNANIGVKTAGANSFRVLQFAPAPTTTGYASLLCYDKNGSSYKGNLGTQTAQWHDLYLSNNLTNGTKSITVAEIVNLQDTIGDIDTILQQINGGSI